MSLPFLGMLNQVAENLGRYNYDTEGIDTTTQRKIIDAFNEAQEFISRVGEPPSLETTISVYLDEDVYEYEYSDFDMDDCNHIYSIKLWDGDKYYPPMTYVIPLTWDQKIAPYIENNTGKPELYTIYNKTIIFSRLPDDAYQIDIRFRFSATKVLNSDSDCDIEEYETGLVLLTTAFVWLKFEEVELYKEYKKMAGEVIKPILGDVRVEPTSRGTSHAGRGGPSYPADFYNNPFIRRAR